MRCYIIGYDLMRPGQNYTALFDAIQSLGNWCRFLDSTWAVKTHRTSDQIYDVIRPKMDANDRLFICDLGRDATWVALSSECSDWLQQNL